MGVGVEAGVKPRLRGVLHQFAAAAALGAGLVLVSVAPAGRPALAAGLYVTSLVVLFAVSATYHRVNWSPRAHARMRRLDHASIFVLIAGTYTPIALVGLPEEQGVRLLIAIWSGALIGIVQAVFWARAPKPLTALLAVLVGWTLVPYIDDVRHALPAGDLALLLGGGVAYTMGAVAYASGRPNPRAQVFGYHEVFHALTIVGAALHFVAVLRLVQGTTA